jgi:hypothetical protein
MKTLDRSSLSSITGAAAADGSQGGASASQRSFVNPWTWGSSSSGTGTSGSGGSRSDGFFKQWTW